MKNYLTKQGSDKIKEDLTYLEKIKRKDISEKIKYAASQGDLSENAAYEAAKEEQGLLEKRIKELREIVANTEIIEKKDKNKISIGSTVYFESEGQKEKFQIVGPEESDILNNKISFKSPLGSSILDKKKGDIVEIQTSEKKIKYKIINIE